MNANSKQNRMVNTLPLGHVLKLQTVVAPHLGALRSHFFSVPPGPPSPVQRETSCGYYFSHLHANCCSQGSHSFCQRKLWGKATALYVVLGNTECIGLLRGEWWF